MPPALTFAVLIAEFVSCAPLRCVSICERILNRREPSADRSLDVAIDVDVTIGTASTGSAAQIASRSLNRPCTFADVLDYVFQSLSQHRQELPVKIITVGLFEVEQFVADPALSLQARRQQEPHPPFMKAAHRLRRISSLHDVFSRSEDCQLQF
jgi:hypothetical protein